MPFIYRNLTLSPHDAEDRLPALVALQLQISPAALRDLCILRKAIDARRKPRVKVIYTVSFSLIDNAPLLARLASEPDLEWQPEPLPNCFAPVSASQRIVLVGSGPAGLFAALRLGGDGQAPPVYEHGPPA